jgi:hypothetical protein
LLIVDSFIYHLKFIKNNSSSNAILNEVVIAGYSGARNREQELPKIAIKKYRLKRM